MKMIVIDNLFAHGAQDVGERIRLVGEPRVSSVYGLTCHAGIDPGRSHGQTNHVGVILDSMLGAHLGIKKPEIVLEFFDAGFDLPSPRVDLNDLFRREGKISGEDRGSERAIATQYEYDLDGTTISSADAIDLNVADRPCLAVDVDHSVAGEEVSRHLFDTWQALTILGWSAPLTRLPLVLREIEQCAVASQTADDMNRTVGDLEVLERVNEGTYAEPSISGDQHAALGALSTLSNLFDVINRDSELGRLAGRVSRRLGLALIATLKQGHEGRTALDVGQEAGENPAKAVDIFGSILFCSVIEVGRSAGNMSTRFAVHRIIHSQHYAAMNV